MEFRGGGAAHKQLRERKSPAQLEILREAFAVDPRPSVEMRDELAKRTGLAVEKVSMWFATARFSESQSPSGGPRRNPGRPPLPPRPPHQSPRSGTTEIAISRPTGESSASGFLGRGGVAHRPSVAQFPVVSQRRGPGRPPLPPRPPRPVERSLGRGIGIHRPFVGQQTWHGRSTLPPPQPSRYGGPWESSPSGSLGRGIPNRPFVPQFHPRSQESSLPSGPPEAGLVSGSVGRGIPHSPFVAPKSRFSPDVRTNRSFGELARPFDPFMQQPSVPFRPPLPPSPPSPPPPPPLSPYSPPPLPPDSPPPLTPPPPPLPQMPHQRLPQLCMSTVWPVPLQKPMMPELQRLLFPHLDSLLPLPLSSFPRASDSQHAVGEDPVYAVGYDPLPPGALSVAIATVSEQGAPAQSSDSIMLEGLNATPIKASTSIPNMGKNTLPTSSTEMNPTIQRISESNQQTSQRALQETKFSMETKK